MKKMYKPRWRNYDGMDYWNNPVYDPSLDPINSFYDPAQDAVNYIPIETRQAEEATTVAILDIQQATKELSLATTNAEVEMAATKLAEATKVAEEAAITLSNLSSEDLSNALSSGASQGIIDAANARVVAANDQLSSVQGMVDKAKTVIGNLAMPDNKKTDLVDKLTKSVSSDTSSIYLAGTVIVLGLLALILKK